MPRTVLFYIMLLHFCFTGFPAHCTQWSSSEHPTLDVEAAEIIRDAPLYPPLQNFEPTFNDVESSLEESTLVNEETDDGTKVQIDDRTKRSSGQEWDSKTDNRRVKTGDTILNIRGSLRDAIGDAGAAPGPRASSIVDTFVIRPSPEHRSPVLHDQPSALSTSQTPKNERELLVEAHSLARITCDVNNLTTLRWYKDNEQIIVPVGPGEAMWRDANSLVISRATRSDSGLWRCAGERAGKTESGMPTRLLIYEPVKSVYLAVDGRRLDAGNTWVPVRDRTVLEVRCVAEGGVPSPDLSWRLLALEPALDHRPYLRIQHTNYSIEGVSISPVVVTAARELHNATLQCAATQRRPHDNAHVNTAKLEIHVTYPPSFVISRWPGFGVSLVSGKAAALRCDVDSNPPAKAWWLRDDAQPASSPPPLEEPGSATLRWATLLTTHAGWYRCRATWHNAEYSSIGYYLNILASEDEPPTPTESEPDLEEPDHQKVEVPVGGNVQLHCPKGSVGCWWRRVVGGNMSRAWSPAGSHHAHGVLGIKDALYQEGGEYRCVGAKGSDMKRLKELKRVTVKVTGAATATALSAVPSAGGWRLECGACGRDIQVLWLRVSTGGITKASLTPDLAQHCHRAVFHVQEADEYWCIAVGGANGTGGASGLGGGAVAVFPARSPHSPPAPARHAVRALQNAAGLVLPNIVMLVLMVSF